MDKSSFKRGSRIQMNGHDKLTFQTIYEGGHTVVNLVIYTINNCLTIIYTFAFSEYLSGKASNGKHIQGEIAKLL